VNYSKTAKLCAVYLEHPVDLLLTEILAVRDLTLSVTNQEQQFICKNADLAIQKFKRDLLRSTNLYTLINKCGLGRHYRQPSLKFAPPGTPDMGNISSNSEHCTVFWVQVTTGHKRDGVQFLGEGPVRYCTI